MSNWLVTCSKHGQGPGYCVCLHVAEGAKAVHVIAGTESELGEALCAECKAKKEVGVDDLILLCAGCFASLQGEK